MAKTFGQLKAELRAIIFPAQEAVNLIAAHDKSFLDAFIEIQTFVLCAQQNNTSLFPHCSTLYNCGLTVIDSAPRGNIMKVSVIDKINATTGLEDAAASDDWCSEIPYNQVDACHIHAYYRNARRFGCCPSIPIFFGLDPSCCGKAAYPTPTDVGLPAGLAKLPLGFHYAQDSTNLKNSRATAGVWAMERGQIWIAPWIQSTETVVVKWDGIKRTWSDADPVDDDPLFARAVKFFVQKEHAGEFDHEFTEEGDFELKWQRALAMLIHQCREETRVRECEPSHARSATVTSLYYNDEQNATAQCPDGQTGNPVTVTISAGSVGSNISVADANQKAKDQALEQAKFQLVCVTPAVTYTNDAQTATASCEVVAGHPPPEGAPVTVTVPAGTVSSEVSKQDANDQALAQAQAQAEAQRSCVFWNSQQTYTATCGTGSTGTPVTRIVPAHSLNSTVSQADADAIAYNTAKVAAENALVCTPGSGSGTVYHNTQQVATATKYRTNPHTGEICAVHVTFTVAANTFTSTSSQAAANSQALAYAQGRANQMAQVEPCGNWTGNYP